MDLVTLILGCSLYADNALVDAMVQVGSKNNPTQVSVETQEGVRRVKSFPSSSAATRFAQAEVNKGRTVEIGLMQIPYRWLEGYKGRVSMGELFRPCKNVVIATDILNQAKDYCASSGEDLKRCTLSVYKTGDMTTGLGYAQRILNYAKNNKKIKNPLLYDETAFSDMRVAPHLPSALGSVGIDDVSEDVKLPPPTFDEEGGA